MTFKVKNQIIIDNIEFFIKNFDGKGVNYKVVAYAQDIEESDMYAIDIYKLGEDLCKSEHVSTLYFDSCGGSTKENVLDELERLVVHILFSKQEYGIIRGF